MATTPAPSLPVHKPLPAPPVITYEEPENSFLIEDEVSEDNTEYDSEYAPAYQYEEPSKAAAIFEEEEDDIEETLKGLSARAQEGVELLIGEILSDESSEVILNGPNSVHYKKNGIRYHLDEIDFGDAKTYHDVIDKFILEYTDTKDRIATSGHLIEGQLQIEDLDNPDSPPTVARVHVMAPPAVKFAKVTIAKKAKRQFTLEDLMARGSFSAQEYEFLKAIARGKVTTVISGLSGSGKTTLLEAMSHYFDQNDRVVIVEDTPELNFPIPDAVYMVSSKPKPGADKNDLITLEWLVQQTNRMRPDRIIVGETRGAEMAEFLIAANSGADGSMTTIHAQDPRGALIKMSNLASGAANSQSEISINKSISSTVQIIIQTGLIEGKHVITHIEEVSDIIRKDSGQIATTTLFEYDRRSNEAIPKGRPSEQLKSFLAARNVPVDLSWFQVQR
ncbi:MAG: CpaF family protein [Enterococcus sp.]|nr:CpaF family protein [Enterococcus sp.]